MGEHELVGVAVVAVPILMNFIKASKINISSDMMPYVAGLFGVAVMGIGGWLMDEEMNKEMIVHALIGAFGPSGFYELALKHVPGIGAMGKPPA